MKKEENKKMVSEIQMLPEDKIINRSVADTAFKVLKRTPNYRVGSMVAEKTFLTEVIKEYLKEIPNLKLPRPVTGSDLKYGLKNLPDLFGETESARNIINSLGFKDYNSYVAKIPVGIKSEDHASLVFETRDLTKAEELQLRNYVNITNTLEDAKTTMATNFVDISKHVLEEVNANEIDVSIIEDDDFDEFER